MTRSCHGILPIGAISLFGAGAKGTLVSGPSGAGLDGPDLSGGLRAPGYAALNDVAARHGLGNQGGQLAHPLSPRPAKEARAFGAIFPQAGKEVGAEEKIHASGVQLLRKAMDCDK